MKTSISRDKTVKGRRNEGLKLKKLLEKIEKERKEAVDDDDVDVDDVLEDREYLAVIAR